MCGQVVVRRSVVRTAYAVPGYVVLCDPLTLLLLLLVIYT